jgi:hypothetical protein
MLDGSRFCMCRVWPRFIRFGKVERFKMKQITENHQYAEIARIRLQKICTTPLALTRRKAS